MLLYRNLLTTIALLIGSTAFTQQYYSVDIIKRADSILKATVGDRIYHDYYHYNTKSYYEYKTSSGKSKWKTLINSKTTKGKFVSISVRYDFCLSKFTLPCVTTYVEFDSLLNLVKPLNVDFIPRCISDNRSCTFIDDSTALTIAKDNFKEKGLRPPKGYSEWSSDDKTYVWRVSNILTENTDAFGDKYGDIEIIVLDALTGKILSQRKTIYFPLR